MRVKLLSCDRNDVHRIPGSALGALDSLHASPPPSAANAFALVFGGAELRDDAALWQALRDRLPGVPLFGCSTAGEICGGRVSDSGVTLALVAFDSCTVTLVGAPIAHTESSYDVGKTLAHALAPADPRCVLVLSEGSIVNGSALIGGLNDHLAPGTLVAGGLAADGTRFERTWVLRDGTPSERWVAALGISGARLGVRHGCQSGWTAFGPARRVTGSRGNTLYSLDDKPALAVYKQYLGDLAAELPGSALRFPLCMQRGPSDREPLVRTILAIDEATQSMRFAGDIPEGTLVRMMHASYDRLIDGAAQAAEDTSMEWSSDDALCLTVSCVGRRMVLGERIEEELDAVLAGLPKGIQQIGFYSYGELSPRADGRCGLHNQTLTLTTLFEHAPIAS